MRIWGLIGAVMILLGLASPASACKCSREEYSNAECKKYMSQFDLVFSGKVISKTDRQRHISMRVRVTKRIRGRPPAIVEVQTPRSSGACGVNLAVGEEASIEASAADRPITIRRCGYGQFYRCALQLGRRDLMN